MGGFARKLLAAWVKVCQRAFLVACLLVAVSGCSRSRYRAEADCDAYNIVQEKAESNAWRPPNGFNIQADPQSRFYDPTPIDDPLLPSPTPRLYGYELPQLPGSQIEQRQRERRRVPPAPDNDLDKNSDTDQAEGGIQTVAHTTFELFVPKQPGVASAPQQGGSDEFEVAASPISQSAWKSIPQSCLTRMFEFASVRDEYEQSHEQTEVDDLMDPARRLTLPDIIQLAQINSREYQTQKETLYRAALRLTLQRFDYDLKFSPFGSGTSGTLTHRRSLGTTVNTLGIPSAVQGDAVLATGGDLLARFANSVVLTFDGPNGFAADIGSSMFLELSQSLFQRDIRFERLTQAERNVVYAARDLARFRKTLFVDLASRYYRLIQNYRQVEIDSQNYFALVREFDQRQAEYEVGLFPRFQVDQVEQNALGGRSSLISTCNRLEQSLDNLKLRIGLPTETPINIDLTELEELTLSDEVGVASDLVRRIRERLATARDKQVPNQAELLDGAIELLIRLREFHQLRSLLGEEGLDGKSLGKQRAHLQLVLAWLRVQEHVKTLTEDLARPNAPRIRLLRDRADVIRSRLRLIERQIQYGVASDVEAAKIDATRTSMDDLSKRFNKLLQDLDDSLIFQQQRIAERLGELLVEAEALQDEVDNAVTNTNAALGIAEFAANEDLLQKTIERIDGLLDVAERSLAETNAGLTSVEISTDDAMFTALLSRFDLMNRRGVLADDWRQIKLAADDLKSILNLSASQSIFTESDINSPLAFTLDDSQTRVSARFDAPLNRRAQRNAFRERLIDYQASRRGLMAFEDNIKLAVRNDLRGLNLSKEQYLLGVTSAALARERSVTTALQLRLGVSGVTARDFLESQTAYARALSDVAARHIDYVVARIQLFLDMELMSLDEQGFWPELYDDRFQPEPGLKYERDWAAPFGDLPPHVDYSDSVKRMLFVAPSWMSE